jgi:hypothetical protein
MNDYRNHLGKLLRGSFITCIAEEDCARVNVRFETLGQAQRFYSALIELTKEEASRADLMPQPSDEGCP